MATEANSLKDPLLSTSSNSQADGRVDWSPLLKLTGFRPFVSKYGLRRYSPYEWKVANDELLYEIPSTDIWLEINSVEIIQTGFFTSPNLILISPGCVIANENKNIISKTSSYCDKEQTENTLRLKQRAVDISSKHSIVSQYCEELKEEVHQMGLCKLRIRRALEFLGIVEGINNECREIRKNRFTEDLVRDQVEEELFQENGLCQEIRLLYTKTLNDFDSQYRTIKGCYQEIHSLWSDQRETLENETENIGLKSSSSKIFFFQGIGRHEGDSSSLEIWEEYMSDILQNIKNTIDTSKALRKKINSPILLESAKDLKQQDEKVLQAFLKRIDELENARRRLESKLNQVLQEIAQGEDLYASLEKLGRQLDFNLKVCQTRLDNRRHRPGAENCRDKPQSGLLHELKIICERVTALEAQMTKIGETLNQLYCKRKKLEREIHVKRHSLYLDQNRCMIFRSKYPHTSNLMGY